MGGWDGVMRQQSRQSVRVASISFEIPGQNTAPRAWLTTFDVPTLVTGVQRAGRVILPARLQRWWHHHPRVIHHHDVVDSGQPIAKLPEWLKSLGYVVT